jgi:hypothetical protein
MASIERERLDSYTTTQTLRRPGAAFSGLLLVCWVGAVTMLLLLVSNVIGAELSLAAKRQMLFFGLIVVELAAAYQVNAYRQRKQRNR